MVAYSFQRRFAEPIIAGTKGGTIRAYRRRPHAQPGQGLQLYVGMRTKQCRLVARKICVESDPIVIDFKSRCVQLPAHLIRGGDLAVFAVFDGFASFDEMAEFWLKTHGVPRFCGRHVRWLPWPEVRK
jgi:hypothetical protein